MAKRTRNFHRVCVLSGLCVFIVFPAAASCLDPWELLQPGRQGLSPALNLMPEGSTLCMRKYPVNCPECEPGFAYQCVADRWVAAPDGACGVRKGGRVFTRIAKN